MKLRPTSLLMSLILVGAVAGAAISETPKASGKKMDVKADLKMVEQAESECKEVQTMLDEIQTTCEGCGKSQDAKTLRGAVDKISKNLKKMKDDEDKLSKQLKSLELEFHAPIGY